MTTIASNPDVNLVEEVTINDLYHYVDSRLKIKEKGFRLKASDSKVYYKLRHNVFKTLFLDLLGFPSTEERPFTDYNIDSNKTPDFLQKFGQFWVLIEFTVVKNSSAAIKNKKSWTKYDYEIELFKQRNEMVYSFYPTFILNDPYSISLNDIINISELLNISFLVHPQSELNQLHEQLNLLEYNISELMPELLLNEEVSTSVTFRQTRKFDKIDDLFQKTLNKVGVKRQRMQNIFLRVKKNSYKLERELKNIRFKANFKIVINNKNNSVYTDIFPDGVSKNVLLTLLQNLSLELVNHVHLIGFFDDSDNPFELYGKTNVIFDDTREELFEESFDTDVYESNFFRRLQKYSRNQDLSEFNLLSNSSLEDQVLLIEENYNEKLNDLRAKKENLIIYNKNIFIFPVANNLEPGKYKKINIKTGLSITDIILNKIVEIRPTEKIIDRKDNLDNLNIALSKQNKSYRKLLSSLGNDYKLARRLKNVYKEETWIKILEDQKTTITDDILSSLRDHMNVKKEITSLIDEPTRTKYANRINIGKNLYRQKWKEEMQHFNQVKGQIKICKEFELNELKNKFDLLLEFLFSERLNKVSDDIYSETEVLGSKFSKICLEMRELIKNSEKRLLHSNLMHNLLFISRICYSLLYYSNIKLNKEDFIYDNLGYTNCLLIVKGGKKILSTKKTRLFKVIFPITEDLIWLYESKFTQIIKSETGQTFCVLPWQTFFFPMVKKGIELYFSFSNYFLSSQLESELDYDTYKKFVSIKVLNMFSQRRKTEIWFGSFRYLYLNSLSTHTSVLELIESMVDYDYDPYLYLMQRLFAKEYINIYLNAKESKIYDIFTEEVFSNFDLCAEKFDETIFMTMAPFDRENEHLKNLKSVLETHDYFLKKYSKDPLEILTQSSVDCNDDEFIKDVFSDDFKFDPKLNFCIGKFAGNYLKRLVSQETLAHEFTKIMQSSFTDISTSKGMRNTHGNFWGSKGHDVLFSNPSVQEEVENFVKHQPKTNTDFKKMLDQSELTFQDKIEEISRIILEFDIKDKNQWKGSREIYVMSDRTKLVQQPLEKFFKILCNWTPNELIHKKSHVRPKFIHSQVFEFETGDEEKTYCTLDCRKWAPRSNLWKYYYFILGMQNLLPQEFIDYFLQIWYCMFYKKIRIQQRYAEIIKNNDSTKHLFDILEKRETDDDFEITMPYSFMMGIFNYLSSLLHAFSQLYFNEKIANKQNAHFNLIAHSDDSGGVILSKSYDTNLLIFKQYEIFQKFCNHLLSKKKSSLSKHFFEIISIMYAKKRLIPMTHKFLGNVSFEPKGKGWVDDISTIVSKVVELFSNGASLTQCYLTMISMSEMIRKFYHLPRFEKLSTLPLAFGGVFNMHPIHLILLGADAQEIMLDFLDSDNDRAFRIKTYISLGGDYFPGKGTQVNYRIPYYKKHEFILDLNEIEQETLKLVSSCFPRRTLGRKMQHYAQLKDSSYVYSLSGVDMSQIFTMTLFSPTFIVKSDNKICDLRLFTKQYLPLKAISVDAGLVDYPKSNFENYIKAAESVNISIKDMTIASQKTCKPITYSTFQNLGLNLTFQTINELIAFNHKVDVKYIFNDTFRLQVLSNWVKSHIPQSEHYDTLEFLQKLSSKDMEKVRSSYCFLPSGVSVDTIERFWTYVNFYATRRYYISNKKPQYFTIDQFELWNLDYDSLKHYYLLLKIILSTEDLNEKMKYMIKENANCSKCLYKDSMINMVSECFSIRNLQEGESLVTNLPFATYQTKQNKSFNVWYGQSEFTLYTMFGDIKMSRDELGSIIYVDILSEEYLSQIWFLYRNFVNTRGLTESRPEYGINDTANFKIGFSDLNQPIVVSPGYKGMLIKSTVVTFQNPKIREILRINKKYTYNGESVDFEIYQNYDINPQFYKDHNLKKLKDIIFEENLNINSDILKRNIRSTKLYRVLMLDEGHESGLTFLEKYSREGLLGSSRSLTKALMIADTQGLTRYRSNVNPLNTAHSLLETQSYKDIPILDLVDKCSFARLTWKEKNVIEYIIKHDSISKTNSIILDKIIDKLGISSTASALTLYSSVFSNLSYKDVVKLNVLVVSDFLLTMIKSALLALDERPKIKGKEILKNNKTHIIKTLAFMHSLNCSNEGIAQLLTKLFLRAHNDNPGTFWENRRENLYCALYKPSKKLIVDQTFFIFACLNYLKNKKILDNIFNVRQIIVAKNILKDHIEKHKKIKSKVKKSSLEHVISKINLKDLENRNYYLDEDSDDLEDDIDLIIGGEDPENPIKRKWDEDEDDYDTKIYDELTLKKAQEDTLLKDFSNVRLEFLSDIIDLPWLGYGNFKTDVDPQGVIWHIADYPGRSLPEKNVFDFKTKVRLGPKDDNIEIIDEEEKTEDKEKDKKVDKIKLMSFSSDEDAYQYQLNVLKNNGIPNPERFRKHFFRKSNFSDKNRFWASFEEAIKKKTESKIKQVTSTRKIRTSILPGFSGNLKDKILKSELKSIFGDHVEEIVAGNHRISENVYKNILMSIKRLFNPSNEDGKALLVVLLAILKDCIIDNNNDSWFVDPVFGIINELDESLNSIDENLYIPPRPLEGKLNYEIVDEYEDYED